MKLKSPALEKRVREVARDEMRLDKALWKDYKRHRKSWLRRKLEAGNKLLFVLPWSYPGESMRVIYVESLGPNEDASDEFATVLIDEEASMAFFEDPWRLSEDILSNGAADCIKKLPDADRLHH